MSFKCFSQVSQLRLELSTRTAELQAAELRLENMEKDLVEISLSNENYRSQVSSFRPDTTTGVRKKDPNSSSSLCKKTNRYRSTLLIKDKNTTRILDRLKL